MKLGILSDPLLKLKPQKDSTLAMIQKALNMGWECFQFTHDDIYCAEGQVYAKLNEILNIDLTKKDWVEQKSVGVELLSSLDIILMRKDPPFDIEYIYATYILELVAKTGVLIANKPQSLRDANEKFFTLNFPQCCPATIVSKNMQVLRDFWVKHQEVVYKPLAAMGGSSVFYVDKNGQNLSVILEVLTQHQTVSIMAQQYIPEIREQGDKRIIIIDGEPIPFALARIPAAGDFRGNLCKGAVGKVLPLSTRDSWICEQIAPTLRAKGLYFVGIDVIGDYLTEINVTSPTGIKEISQETNIDIAGMYLNALNSKLFS